MREIAIIGHRCTMSQPMKLVCRPTIYRDLQAVLDIGTQYNGMDYLEARWDWFIHNQNVYSFLGEVEGKVVAFCYLYVIDNGESIVSGGARVHPAYRRYGFNTALGKFARSQVAKLVAPSAMRNIFFVAVNNDVYKNPPSRIRVLARRALRDYKMTSSQLHSYVTSRHMAQLCKDYQLDEVKEASKELLVTHMMNDQVSGMFPAGRFIADWIPYGVNESSIEMATEFADAHITINKESGRMEAVSFLTAVLCPVCVRLDVEIYHKEGNSSYTIQHILKALQYFQSKKLRSNPDVLNFIVFTPTEDKNEVDEISEIFKWKEGGLLSEYDEYLFGKRALTANL